VNNRKNVETQINKLQRELQSLSAKYRSPDETPVNVLNHKESLLEKLAELREELKSMPVADESKPQSVARILYLDDLPDWRSMVGGLLREYGYDVLVVGTVQDASKILRRDDTINLAVIDVRLDESNEKDQAGIHFAFRLRDEGYELPIILLTAYKPDYGLVVRITRPPNNFVLLEKGDIGRKNNDDLLYQIKQILPLPPNETDSDQ
jgi:CheY-like chemotaxis protein